MTDNTTSTSPLLYEIKIGLIFRRQLTVTQEGILWKGRLVRFNDIISTGWGGTRHYYNGIPTGTVHTIHLDDGKKRNVMTITTRRKAVYSKIVDLVWQYAGVDILTRLLTGLQSGERYVVGASMVTDDGIHITQKRLFKDPQVFFFPWHQVSLARQQGSFIIQGARGISEQLAYNDNNNTHIIDYAITMAKEHGFQRLSDLLQSAS